MTKLIAMLFTLFSFSAVAEEYFGAYVQQSPEFNSKNLELVQKARAKFESNKNTISINSETLDVYLQGEKYWSFPYTIEGKTIVSRGPDGMYWVLYIENKNTLHSTLTKFHRVQNGQP